MTLEQEYPQEEPFYYEDKYLYDNFWYCKTFPLEWAQSHLDGTGPNCCMNCADFGCVFGVFIGYCANCAIHDYEGVRGRGFMGDGEEYSGEDSLDYPSAFDTYLKDINVDDITPIPGSHDGDDSEHSSYAELDVSIMNPHFEGGYNDW
jgi:hypothetical protein